MKSDPKVVKALEESIKHWKRLRAGEETDATDSNCALCQTFIAQNTASRCAGCPLYEAGLECNLRGSPWREACDAVGGRFEFPPKTEQALAAVDHMIMMLVLLLEEERSKDDLIEVPKDHYRFDLQEDGSYSVIWQHDPRAPGMPENKVGIILKSESDWYAFHPESDSLGGVAMSTIASKMAQLNFNLREGKE